MSTDSNSESIDEIKCHKSKPKTTTRAKRERKPGFCGLCKGEGLRVTFKNCHHFSCEACYEKAGKDAKCTYCDKNIK